MQLNMMIVYVMPLKADAFELELSKSFRSKL